MLLVDRFTRALCATALGAVLTACSKGSGGSATPSPAASPTPAPATAAPTVRPTPFKPSQADVIADPERQIGRLYVARGCGRDFKDTLGWLSARAVDDVVHGKRAEAEKIATAVLRDDKLCTMSSDLIEAEGDYALAIVKLDGGDSAAAGKFAAAAFIAAEAAANDQDATAGDRTSARQIIAKIHALDPNV